jgi:hypothetical protein
VPIPFVSTFSPFCRIEMELTWRVRQSNYDLVDYINGLREGILEAYVGIVSGLKGGGKVDILLPHVNSIFSFLHLALTDQDRTETILRSSIGLLGDLAEAFPRGQLKEALGSPWVAEVLKTARTKAGGTETKRLAKWAKEVRSCPSPWIRERAATKSTRVNVDDQTSHRLIARHTVPFFGILRPLYSTIA